MTTKKRYLRVANALFVILMLVQLLPNRISGDAHTAYLIGFAAVLEIIVLAVSTVSKTESGLNLFLDIIAFLYAFLIFWTLAAVKFNILSESLFPPMGKVIWQLIDDAGKILVNIRSSLGIIIEGYLLAVIAAIPLGLFLGNSARAGGAASYISKFLGFIPPIVYIPYGIALLPTFRSVSVFVIFLATFWPVFASTMSGVLNVEQKTIDSAKVLNVSKPTMLFSVILPAALPQIFIGCNQGLGISFILLTSAEMIGASSGLGYYVKQYSDFGDYTRAIGGILIIGAVVVAISFLFNKLQNYLLRWRK
ncbi:MAG: ABC transporter permease subunit [Oscillospiraceae bacterium]|nr:ABC transporter permease subunit [Oscillospiraceae bacterium]